MSTQILCSQLKQREAVITAKPTLFRLAAVMAFIALSAVTSAAQPVPQTKRVLIVSGYGPNSPGGLAVNERMQEVFSSSPQKHVEVYYEFEDHARIPNPQYEDKMAAFLKEKYADEGLNLIIGFGGPAADFLLKHEADLFPGIPKLFYFHDQQESKVRTLWPRLTGVWTAADLTRTLEMALALHPATQAVTVVSGDSAQDRFFREQAEQQYRKYEGKIQFTYLHDLNMNELKTRLAAVAPNSVVIYLSFFVDKNGNSYSGPEALSLFAPSCSAPIYGVAETYVGSGVVGGSVIDFPAIGARLGELTVRILNGEDPHAIPPLQVPSVAMFDWRQLQRWRIDQSKLPPGSIVQFRQSTLWEA